VPETLPAPPGVVTDITPLPTLVVAYPRFLRIDLAQPIEITEQHLCWHCPCFGDDAPTYLEGSTEDNMVCVVESSPRAIPELEPFVQDIAQLFKLSLIRVARGYSLPANEDSWEAISKIYLDSMPAERRQDVVARILEHDSARGRDREMKFGRFANVDLRRSDSIISIDLSHEYGPVLNRNSLQLSRNPESAISTLSHRSSTRTALVQSSEYKFLRLFLHDVFCSDETNACWWGMCVEWGDDETYLSGVTMDGKGQGGTIREGGWFKVGDFNDGWRKNYSSHRAPYGLELTAFNLKTDAHTYPAEYNVVLTLIEHDYGKLSDFTKKLMDKVSDLAEGVPIVGTVINAIIDAIKGWLEDEVIAVHTYRTTIPDRRDTFPGNVEAVNDVRTYQGAGGTYLLQTFWVLDRQDRPHFSSTFESGWTPGWSSFARFTSSTDGHQYLLMYKKNEGTVCIDHVLPDGTGSRERWRSQWSKGWTSIVSFKLGNRSHLLLYNKDSGSVEIHRLQTNFEGTTKTWSSTWSRGWTSFVPFELAGQSHILMYKSQQGDVSIDRINPDGVGTKEIWRTSWSKDWTSLVHIDIGSIPHLLGYKQSTGRFCIDRIKADGQGVDSVWEAQQDEWAKGLTSLTPFTVNGQLYVLSYNKGTGAVAFDHIKDDGKGTQVVFDSKWSTSWTAFVPLQFGDQQFIFSYKSGDGRVCIDHIFEE
jgi:hypothetical protein